MSLRTSSQIDFRSTVLGIFGTTLLLCAWMGRTASAQGQEPPQEHLEEGEVVITARQGNYVRNGPGSFHEVLVVVKKEIPLTVQKQKGNWIQVTLPDDRQGWLSTTSIRKGTSRDEVSTQEVAKEWTTTKATKSGIAAAVRGFQMRADGLEEGSIEALMAYLHSTPSITERDVDHFRKSLDASEQAGLELEDLDFELAAYNPTVEERQVGFAVATRLVDKGVVKAPRVQRYLTLITEQLTAETPYFDWNFEVVIIEGEGPDAFACPGGILFLTRGVFVHFQNEAQLAGLLAHEIGHVVRRHGMVERDKRSVKRKADRAFAELEAATEDDDERYEEVEEDLDAMMRQSYERLINDRLLEYEIEADRVAAALLSEAGYSSLGIVHAVERIAALRSRDPDLFDQDYLEVKNIQERVRKVEAFVNSNGGREGGVRLSRRFDAYATEVR